MSSFNRSCCSSGGSKVGIISLSSLPHMAAKAADHEIAIGEIPLLEHDPVAGIFQNAADLGSEQRVGACPTDEKIWAG
jgi:hypothetical protein